VLTVNWGEDGIRTCQTEAPALIILDIRLPDIDGYEVARRLRKDRRSAEIPIIFLTEKLERSDRLQGLELGGDDYITKPFDVQELRLRVRNSLKRASQGSLTNPVTGLPEGTLVDEKLTDLLAQDGSVVLVIEIRNMDVFREAYGFVAFDDVLRAVSLMIVNTIKEAGSPQDFLGHLGGSEFILVTQPGDLNSISEKLQTRLDQSMGYFYPIRERDQAVGRKNQLAAHLRILNIGRGRYTRLEDLKAELNRLKRPGRA
jgi:PleD family two-component response regulator